MKKPTHLLTADELYHVEQFGVDFGVKFDLVRIDSDDMVVFTVKGLATFQYAIQCHGYPGKLTDIRTLKELKEFQFDIQKLVLQTHKVGLLAMHEQNPELDKYRPVTDAILGGTPSQGRDMLKQALRIRESGGNVSMIPVSRG